jgi:hypothetical protein
VLTTRATECLHPHPVRMQPPYGPMLAAVEQLPLLSMEDADEPQNPGQLQKLVSA